MTSAPAKPTIYIPTVKGGAKLQRCLESIEAQTAAAEVVVADNGTGTATADLLADRFPSVIRIGFDGNLGFGRALNRAIAEQGEGPIILLNDDVVANPDLVELMLEDSRRAELVAAVLLSERNPARIDSAGVVVDQTLMAFDYLSGTPIAALDTARDPLGPTGGAALYGREAFNAVGGFDERIFIYYEDVDLALRMRREGARCVLSPDAQGIHHYSGTLGARTGNKYAMTGWGRGYLLRRYGVMSSPGTAAQTLCREVVVCAGQLAEDHTAAGLLGRIRGWRDAGGLPQRTLPQPDLIRLSLGNALSLRRRSHTG